MTRPIEECVLSVLLDRESMSLAELREALDHNSAIPFVLLHFMRLGYIHRNEDGDTYSLTKSGRICINLVQEQQAPTP
ncbi:hypothetical protein [uncultured Methanolobus sp.]|uniref:hypothetical protein n=1 Tax=uncultured Methanolobus sp. TaxID=218300 RepID=UPI0029C76E38|nr:hypothetical protein [uncultured Methanolobus sp.]